MNCACQIGFKRLITTNQIQFIKMDKLKDKDDTLNITKKQLSLLTFIYQFRFVTSRHVQYELGQKDIGNADRLLKQLANSGYVNTVLSGEERKITKPAIFYLTPKSIDLLKEVKGTSNVILSQIHKDTHAPESYIKHCLTIGNINLEFKRLHGSNLMFACKSDMATYNYLPKDLPDAFIEINGMESKPRDFFLYYYEEDIPVAKTNKQLRHFVEYTESKIWQKSTVTQMPSIIIIFQGNNIPIPFLRYAKWTVKNANTDELNILATTMSKLKDSTDKDDRVWRYIDLEGLADEEDPYIKLI
jgi:hypothetical protein